MDYLDRIIQLAQKYPSEEGYVFKSCSKKWIVVLQKLSNTITNEARLDVVDPMYAKFRANKLLVVDIIHKFTNQTIDQIENSVYKQKIIYKKGLLVEIFNFGNNPNDVYAPGIHYFNSLEAAFYFELDEGENIIIKSWHDNGRLWKASVHRGGQMNGLYKEWDVNGKLYIKCIFKDGKKNGSYKKWYESDQLFEECTFEDGKLNGLYKSWYCSGHLKEECTYKNGIPDGPYKKWYPRSQPCEECTYKDGNPDGLYRKWYASGHLTEECAFKNGKLDGLFKSWYMNGELITEGMYKDGKLYLDNLINLQDAAVIGGIVGLGIYCAFKSLMYFKKMIN
jgi:antitoxin component YwqK of YwqJK toxin-antitoxin module